MQVKLLRVLQEHVYEPLGSTEPVEANVRVITATHQDLREKVRLGEFRLDLYYRINVMRLDIPPLRKRREDIPILIDHFMRHYNKVYSKGIISIAPDALAMLMRHSFPGNCRELENIIEHAFVLCTGTMIDMDHLPVEFLPDEPGNRPDAGEGASCMQGTLENVEREMLLEALQRNKWNRQNTARELGIHKATLFRKIKKLDITLPDIDGRYKAE